METTQKPVFTEIPTGKIRTLWAWRDQYENAGAGRKGELIAVLNRLIKGRKKLGPVTAFLRESQKDWNVFLIVFRVFFLYYPTAAERYVRRFAGIQKSLAEKKCEEEASKKLADKK